MQADENAKYLKEEVLNGFPNLEPRGALRRRISPNLRHGALKVAEALRAFEGCKNLGAFEG